MSIYSGYFHRTCPYFTLPSLLTPSSKSSSWVLVLSSEVKWVKKITKAVTTIDRNRRRRRKIARSRSIVQNLEGIITSKNGRGEREGGRERVREGEWKKDEFFSYSSDCKQRRRLPTNQKPPPPHSPSLLLLLLGDVI